VPEHQPQIQHQPAQPYVAIPEVVTMQGLPGVIDNDFRELFGWLASHSLAPAGPPFIRYLEIDMDAELSIELAVPVDVEPPADGRIRPGTLPAGRYVTFLHVGHYNGLVEANAELQRWAQERGIVWQFDDASRWGGRVERYVTDPSKEPDPSAWKTELAYLIAEH
jgi:effector-binding domain-containing protein